MRDAGRGAAFGAIGGAIAGNAGKGAAIGALSGVFLGGMRRSSRRAEQERWQRQQQANAQQQQQQANAQWQQGVNIYNRAYAACMGARNYQIN